MIRAVGRPIHLGSPLLDTIRTRWLTPYYPILGLPRTKSTVVKKQAGRTPVHPACVAAVVWRTAAVWRLLATVKAAYLGPAAKGT